MIFGLKNRPALFFSDEEKKRLVSAVKKAEELTSGEIRICLEKKTKSDVLVQAKKMFKKLGMTKTQHRNGVLIYLALDRREFAVIGDEGIHQKVGADFWTDIVGLIQQEFTLGKFAQGLELGILKIGEKLQRFFPRTQRDVNELPDSLNEIS